jgi:hypothetical protein
MRIMITIPDEQIVRMLQFAGFKPTDEQIKTILADKEFAELLEDDILVCFQTDALDDTRAGDSSQERYGDVMDRLGIELGPHQDEDEDEDEEDSDLDDQPEEGDGLEDYGHEEYDLGGEGDN